MSGAPSEIPSMVTTARLGGELRNPLYYMALMLFDLHLPILDQNNSDYPATRTAYMNYDYNEVKPSFELGRHGMAIKLPGLVSRTLPGTPYRKGTLRPLAQPTPPPKESMKEADTPSPSTEEKKESVEERGEATTETTDLPPERSTTPVRDPPASEDVSPSPAMEATPSKERVEEAAATPNQTLSPPPPLEEKAITPTPAAATVTVTVASEEPSVREGRRATLPPDTRTEEEKERDRVEGEKQLKYLLQFSLPLLGIIPLPAIAAQSYRTPLVSVQSGETTTTTTTEVESVLHSTTGSHRLSPPLKTMEGERLSRSALLSLIALLPHTLLVQDGDQRQYVSFPLKIGLHVDDPHSLRSALWGGCQPFYLRACSYRLIEYFQPASSLFSVTNTTTTTTTTTGGGGGGTPFDPKSPLQSSYRSRSVVMGAASHGNSPTLPAGTLKDRSPSLSSTSLFPNGAAGVGAASSGPLQPPLGGSGTNNNSNSSYPTANDSVVYTRYDRMVSDLAQKRRKYENYVRQYWTDEFYQPKQEAQEQKEASLTSFPSSSTVINNHQLNLNLVPHERAILNQIALDLPRHKTALFHSRTSSYSLARVIFLFSQRHPAVGYVQGMDDVFHMFYLIFFTDALRMIQCQRHGTLVSFEGTGEETRVVEQLISLEYSGTLVTEEFLSSPLVQAHQLEAVLQTYFTQNNQTNNSDNNNKSATTPPAPSGPSSRSVPLLLQVEADAYFCTAELLSQLQDNYRPGQPGLRAAGARVEQLLRKEGPDIMKVCEENGINVIDGCFQWFHCLLLRELPLPLSLMLWDTYKSIAVEEVYSVHQCICTALLLCLRTPILTGRPELLMMLLKSPYSTLFPDGFPSLVDCGYYTAATGTPKTKEQEEKMKERRKARKKQIEWMEVLIADGYRIWRQHF